MKNRNKHAGMTEKLCDTMEQHCHLCAVPAISTTCRDTTLNALSPSITILKDCPVQVFFMTYQIHCSQIGFSFPFHHTLRVQILLSHSLKLFILWLQTISPDPLLFWETLGAEPQELRRCWDHTWMSLSLWEKAKAKIEVVSIPPRKDDSGDYSDSSSSLWCPERPWVPLSAVGASLLPPYKPGRANRNPHCLHGAKFDWKSSMNISGIPRVTQACF